MSKLQVVHIDDKTHNILTKFCAERRIQKRTYVSALVLQALGHLPGGAPGGPKSQESGP